MGQKISVLCAVREDGVFRTLMQEMDDGETCVFCIVHSGSDALRMCGRMIPDILITDAILPVIDGPALVDRGREMLGKRMPRVIGGAMMPFARDSFERHGAARIVCVPWNLDEVRAALTDMIREIGSLIDWENLQPDVRRAGSLLRHMGMHPDLHGFGYLSWAAALAAQNESRLRAVGKMLYAPIAAKEGTTPQNVERLIRHAVERTMDVIGAEELYAFFGNTIDPARGKPSNAQMIGMLAQRIRVE